MCLDALGVAHVVAMVVCAAVMDADGDEALEAAKPDGRRGMSGMLSGKHCEIICI